MNRGEDDDLDTSDPAGAVEGTGRGEAWATTRQAVWGLLRLCLVILAALAGAATVEAVRALF